MDRKLRKILTECIRDIETGARDVEGCLQLHSDRAAELRPHLELWSGLNASAKAQPSLGSQQRGRQQMLSALSDMDKAGGRRMIPTLFAPAAVKAVAALAAVALLVGGGAGASAALGGPDVTHSVLSGIGLSNASDTGKQHANPNALDGADNASQGRDNASETGQNNANPKASEGAGNADGAGNASDNASDRANPNASQGSDNADDLDDDDAGDTDDDDTDDGDTGDDDTDDGDTDDGDTDDDE